MNESTHTEPKLLVNKIRTPDGTILHSISRHDCMMHIDKNGEHYMTDGGFEYIHRSAGHKEPYTELDVYTDDPHEKIRSSFCWGTRGKDGKSKLEYRVLDTLSTNHIQAILETQHQLRDYIRKVFEDELAYRLTLPAEAQEAYKE